MYTAVSNEFRQRACGGVEEYALPLIHHSRTYCLYIWCKMCVCINIHANPSAKKQMSWKLLVLVVSVWYQLILIGNKKYHTRRKDDLSAVMLV